MNQKSRRSSLPTGLARRTAMAAGVAVACLMFSGHANTQGIFTSDRGALAKLIAQYTKQIEAFRQQVQQYQLQLQQYQQMVTSVQNIRSNLSLSSNELQHVTDVQSLIRAKCSGASGAGGLVSSVMNSMSSLMTQSITQTQKMICGQIVTTQVGKYNKTVDMLNELHRYAGQFHQLEGTVNTGNTQHDTEQITALVAKYTGAVNTEMSNWQAQVKADDAVISTLENQQSILGSVALSGSSTVLGNVIQATTFAAAFH